ncbi:hypothetical protein Z945_1471 [Sulfitobacter noctilucae]|uniref:hypothetical protein n=1 Tax=Sulfitobacter noctilucae TaxID=1342302 RepID=UPI00046A3B2A|nr:hypothetical protein [Sulfitobacter noctilucae]KIN60497.1 hypothetical protein Z945_1471 [Sulfitobacter noctilucae]
MQGSTAKTRSDAPRRVQSLAAVGMFVALTIALHGLLLSVEYRWAEVLDVDTMAGRDASHRMVLFETPERLRVLQTGDRLIPIQKGAKVCVSRRRIIARRWLRYRIELPGYCRGVPRNLPPQSVFTVG